jgi:L-seryl-tRNA(Ser) seleniumtransferase
MSDNPYRQLPSVNDVLAAVPTPGPPHNLVVDAVRAELADLRSRLGAGIDVDGDATVESIAQRVALRLTQVQRPNLRSVINATGIVLHTNLGRAPMAEAAADAARDAARSYLTLEMDLATGQRSSRLDTIRGWLTRLTGAEAATAVNNNAAATIIALRTICSGKEAVVSRGQLIEIGGSFRIPEIMAVSGAMLREVGTTNITRLADYRNAIGPNTGALLRVHCSNYRVRGFTEAVALGDLVDLGRQHSLPVIDDVGSGALIDFTQFGFDGEPLVRDSVTAGADLVLCSGDKLLGGPQAGLIVGKKSWIDRIERDPLMRAFRLDKMTLAALEATLRLYLDEEQALHDVPVLRLLAIPPETLRLRAEALAERLRSIPGLTALVREDRAYVGGGSLPDQTLPSWVVAIQIKGIGEEELARRLRLGRHALIGRLHDGQLLLDVRTIFPTQETDLITAMTAAASIAHP